MVGDSVFVSQLFSKDRLWCTFFYAFDGNTDQDALVAPDKTMFAFHKSFSKRSLYYFYSINLFGFIRVPQSNIDSTNNLYRDLMIFECERSEDPAV